MLGSISLKSAIGYGIAISAVLILTRLASSFGAAGFTKIVSRFITVADPNPGWKMPLITGWAGMRGVVSLAAALSIPIALPGGASFPLRNLTLLSRSCHPDDPGFPGTHPSLADQKTKNHR